MKQPYESPVWLNRTSVRWVRQVYNHERFMDGQPWVVRPFFVGRPADLRLIRRATEMVITSTEVNSIDVPENPAAVVELVFEVAGAAVRFVGEAKQRLTLRGRSGEGVRFDAFLTERSSLPRGARERQGADG